MCVCVCVCVRARSPGQEGNKAPTHVLNSLLFALSVRAFGGLGERKGMVCLIPPLGRLGSSLGEAWESVRCGAV